jgi:hypothetical protein
VLAGSLLMNKRKGGRAHKCALPNGQAAQERRRLESLEAWLAMVDSWPAGVTFPGLPDGDRKAEEMVRIIREMVSESCPN